MRPTERTERRVIFLLMYSNGCLVEVAEANRLNILRPMRGEVLGHVGVNKAFALDSGNEAAKEAARWHFTLALLGAEVGRTLSLQDNNISRIRKVSCCVCRGYVYGKIARKPFPTVLPSSKVRQSLQIVHSVIAGLIYPKLFGGTLFLLVFTDNFTRHNVSYLLKRKSSSFGGFKEHKAWLEK